MNGPVVARAALNTESARPGRTGGAPSLPRARSSPWLVLRPLAALVPLCLCIHILLQSPTVPSSPDTTSALIRALEAKALETEPLDVIWLDPIPGSLQSIATSRRALVRAHEADSLSDIYLARVRSTPEGRVWRLVDLAPLSETSAVDEQQLVASDTRAAWTIGGADRTHLIYFVDLRGEPLPPSNRWGTLARYQVALTNLQEFGTVRGVRRRVFKLATPARNVTLGFAGDSLLVQADGRLVTVPTSGTAQLPAEGLLTEERLEKGRPGNLVTWAVDRVRAMPWFGADRMQALKAVAFSALDVAERLRGDVTGDDGADALAEELGELNTYKPTGFTRSDIGWPPAPIRPVLAHPLEGEGQWRSLGGDPFIAQQENAPPPFVFTFIRVDPERKWSQTFITLWDPRQVELHTMSGTREPKSATGETGPGLVPRNPKTMRRYAAALNGGFQATHGEFGMMADGVVYLPPKPFAATVVRLADGSTGFGTWPRDESIPENIVSFRQNMTPLVLDGTHNPYQRTWWGGVPPGWDDETRTVRTALCLTEEGFVAYIYGLRLEAEHLAKAMLLTRCSYGIHLDMNPGHTGLEFYHAAPAEELPKPSRRLDSQWEATGKVPGMPGWEFLSRRMIRNMGLMNFPRYIQREQRDFFYLTLRPVLPGAHPRDLLGLPTSSGSEGLWTTSGLPQHGWPHAIATSTLKLEVGGTPTLARLLKMDAHAVMPETEDGEQREKIVVLRRPSEQDEGTSLWWTPTGWRIADQGGADSVLVARGASAAGSYSAAMCIDQDDMLVLVELADGQLAAAAGPALERVLSALRCDSTIFLESPQPLVAGVRDLGGNRIARRRNGLAFVRGQFPSARRIFTETPIVPPGEWQPLQAKRVRYFKERTQTETATPQSDSTANGLPASETGGEHDPKGPPPT